MLNYNPNCATVKRGRDKPWLLIIIAFFWLCGTAFFHSPWEPDEPFVMAVVKDIIRHHSWLVPHIAGEAYLSIQPFYFWIYAFIIKLFNISTLYSITNSVRLINTLFIAATLWLSCKVGSNLKAFKNGRSVLLLLISSIGFIDNTYQLTPHLIVILGFCVYLYALQLHLKLPGISACLLFIGLLLISINYSAEYIILAIGVLLLMPILFKEWRSAPYLITVTFAFCLFGIVFGLYCYELFNIQPYFFLTWRQQYLDFHLVSFNWSRLQDVVIFLSWYCFPWWFLVVWTIYKRRSNIFADPVILIAGIISLAIIIFSLFSNNYIENDVFPIVLLSVLVASLEVDSIRLNLVALLNWFSIFIFGSLGFVLWLAFLFLNLYKFKLLSSSTPWVNNTLSVVLKYTQNYMYRFEFFDLLFAIIITIIWLFLISRKHIRGREAVTNWASGTTFVLILFMCLGLKWFDSILNFRAIVASSLNHIDPHSCILTKRYTNLQVALWSYYADINLKVIPGDINDNTSCDQAIIVADNTKMINRNLWRIVWIGKRPIDKVSYILIKRNRRRVANDY